MQACFRIPYAVISIMNLPIFCILWSKVLCVTFAHLNKVQPSWGSNYHLSRILFGGNTIPFMSNADTQHFAIVHDLLILC